MPIDQAQSSSNHIKQFAKGVDEAFKILVYLSPIALFLLLFSEEMRELGWLIMLVGVAVSVVYSALRNW